MSAVVVLDDCLGFLKARESSECFVVLFWLIQGVIVCLILFLVAGCPFVS